MQFEPGIAEGNILKLLEQAGEEREENIYKELFGGLGDGIYTLNADI